MTAKRKYASPTMQSLSLDTPDGCCVFCQDPLPEKRPHNQICCGTVECLASRDRVRKGDYRAEKRCARNEADLAEAFEHIRSAFSLLFSVRSRVIAVEAARREA